ncbi:MAG: hypothetical protein PHQ12_06685 [Chthoniobacteraceae bacterium]|nr:hypothetical protein [Chthoniobacteraceae bacterium]
MSLPRLFTLTLAGLFAAVLAVPCHAQEGGTPIKITSTLHDDGSRTDTQKDLDNRTEETRTYNAAKKLVQRWVYSLDDQGREVDGVCYDAKDKVIGRVSYKYDPFGHVGEVTEKTPNGTVVRRTVYHRNPDGKVTGTDTFDAQGNPVNPKPAPAPKRGRSR